ncbi:hypothetical protein GT370_10230 [Acidocella sp. MX-AZ03]|uniref:hypothetical protein n=1 Tax=Acidocella sp. MX-AZ03 TaxID=2697363 RepID=UPI0022DDC0B1|nr:hypothetical protein [Acidocella sp. MX-AZ03]WBO61046.1 hypothetical protein GT370_10230 [Acidocella sp. MX-AZ03]
MGLFVREASFHEWPPGDGAPRGKPVLAIQQSRVNPKLCAIRLNKPESLDLALQGMVAAHREKASSPGEDTIRKYVMSYGGEINIMFVKMH